MSSKSAGVAACRRNVNPSRSSTSRTNRSRLTSRSEHHTPWSTRPTTAQPSIAARSAQDSTISRHPARPAQPAPPLPCSRRQGRIGRRPRRTVVAAQELRDAGERVLGGHVRGEGRHADPPPHSRPRDQPHSDATGSRRHVGRELGQTAASAARWKASDASAWSDGIRVPAETEVPARAVWGTGRSSKESGLRRSAGAGCPARTRAVACRGDGPQPAAADHGAELTPRRGGTQIAHGRRRRRVRRARNGTASARHRGRSGVADCARRDDAQPAAHGRNTAVGRCCARGGCSRGRPRCPAPSRSATRAERSGVASDCAVRPGPGAVRPHQPRGRVRLRPLIRRRPTARSWPVGRAWRSPNHGHDAQQRDQRRKRDRQPPTNLQPTQRSDPAVKRTGEGHHGPRSSAPRHATQPECRRTRSVRWLPATTTITATTAPACRGHPAERTRDIDRAASRGESLMSSDQNGSGDCW